MTFAGATQDWARSWDGAATGGRIAGRGGVDTTGGTSRIHPNAYTNRRVRRSSSSMFRLFLALAPLLRRLAKRRGFLLRLRPRLLRVPERVA